MNLMEKYLILQHMGKEKKRLVLFTFHKSLQFDLNCTDLQMSPKHINVLGPWTLTKCVKDGTKNIFMGLLVDTPLESTTIIAQICWMLVVVQNFFHVGGWNFIWFSFRLGVSCYATMVKILEHYH
jgi:hypothetical protein